ncbi:hypothetical protein OS175_10650 [Marinicella sp. S1101]|uniref:hypothetical protein n=1 Tax=Marinicella marina TaxID=2996016 RepID=UPI002260D2DD|nr:hypothetical protein [Marinicella marina]MCX7554340.1 hypothetical protein [Marinicella marina]MDJ1138669.1 hypothetical protein [Marinicella marina]
MKKTTLILSLLVSASAFSFDFPSPSDATAKLVFNHSSGAKQMFPVKLLEVNGENVIVRDSAAWFNAGEYILNFASNVDTRYTKAFLTPQERRNSQLQDWNTELRIKVESGKTYYIGFDASSSDSKEWQPVIYKVE